MSKDIRLSPKHGLNPCIPVCFYCGEQKNEIALMGRINRQDDEAPHSCVLDYNPCQECEKKFEQGVLLIEATTSPNQPNQPPITPMSGAYPTGRYVVVKPERVKDRRAGDRCLITPELFEEMFGQAIRQQNS